MIEIELENVRCFRAVDPVEISPLTMLVGENSTGKSSFLALVRIAFEVAKGQIFESTFNSPPFFWGAYKQVAYHGSDKEHPSDNFKISLHVNRTQNAVSRGKSQASFVTTFEEVEDQPSIKKYEFKSPKFSFTLTFSNKICKSLVYFIDEKKYTAPKDALDYLSKVSQETTSHMNIVQMIPRFFLMEIIADDYRKKHKVKDGDFSVKVFSYADKIATECNRAWQEAYKEIDFTSHAFAPVRTEPKRTYESVRALPDASGNHIPLLLSNLLNSEGSASRSLKNSIVKFGKAAGLFTGIDIERLGKSRSDPFRVMINVPNGQKSNLLDVGYGVSQALPLIVDLLSDIENKKDKKIYLIQQPEVHLHPRGQAELGSLLYSVTSKNSLYSVVETHSDYLLDRIRFDIRDDKKIKKSDFSAVSFLYFERLDSGVKIHSMKVDSQGNIESPPECYRKFFLNEEERLFGF